MRQSSARTAFPRLAGVRLGDKPLAKSLQKGCAVLVAQQDASLAQSENDQQASQPVVSGRQWRLLAALTVLWLPSLAIAVAMASGSLLAGDSYALQRSVLWAAIAFHSILVLAAWGVVVGRLSTARLERYETETGQFHQAPPEENLARARLQALSPSEFEAWVQDLFEGWGYHVENTPDGADHGVDLRLVSPDGERAIVQCKRYEGTVSESVVRDLYGAMQHDRLDRGFVVTTGRFSQAAARWAQGKPIELIDGERLVQLAEARPE